MAVIITYKWLVIKTEPKVTQFDLPKYVNNSLKHKNYFIIKHNEFVA